MKLISTLALTLSILCAAGTEALAGAPSPEERQQIDRMLALSNRVYARAREVKSRCGTRATEGCRNEMAEMCDLDKGREAWLFHSVTELSSASQDYFARFCAPHAKRGSELLRRGDEARRNAPGDEREGAELGALADYYGEQGLAACSAYWQNYALLRKLYKDYCSSR